MTARGYAYRIFLSKPSDEYQCSVCRLVLRDACQLECCGASVCELCAANVTASVTARHHENDCEDPCRDKNPDHRIRRIIKEMNIRCMANSDCHWTGELVYHDKHIDKECPVKMDKEKEKREKDKAELKAKFEKIKGEYKILKNARQAGGRLPKRTPTGLINAKRITAEEQQKLNEEIISKAFSAKWNEVLLLIKSGANVNTTNKEGQTPLHYASKNGILDCVEQLLSFGALPDSKDKRRVTPLHLAARYGHTEIVQFLISFGANINLIDTDRQTALHLASVRGHTKIVEELLKDNADLETLDRSQCTALINACKNGHFEIVMHLLSHGTRVDPKACEMYQMTSLHIAAAAGYKEIVAALLSYNAKPCIKDEYGHTALNWAILRGNTEAAETILLLSDAAGIIEDNKWKTTCTVLLATVLNNESVLRQLTFCGITTLNIKEFDLLAEWKAQTDGFSHKLTYLNTKTKEQSDRIGLSQKYFKRLPFIRSQDHPRSR